MFNTKLTLAGLVVGAAVGVTGGAFLLNQMEAAHRAELLAQVPSAMGRDDALAIAQQRFPGAELEEDELECENGRLVYEFEFDTPEGSVEIAIDPVTGAVLSQEADDEDGADDEDAAEAADDASEAQPPAGAVCESEVDDD